MFSLPITKRNVLQHELIGLRVRVVNSTNPSLIGVQGTIIDETRETLVIEGAGKSKVIPKASAILRIVLPSGEWKEVDGVRLVARPEERIKKFR